MVLSTSFFLFWVVKKAWKYWWISMVLFSALPFSNHQWPQNGCTYKEEEFFYLLDSNRSFTQRTSSKLAINNIRVDYLQKVIQWPFSSFLHTPMSILHNMQPITTNVNQIERIWILSHELVINDVNCFPINIKAIHIYFN